MIKENILYTVLTSSDYKKPDEDVPCIQLILDHARKQNLELKIIRTTEIGIKAGHTYSDFVELLKQSQLGNIERIYVDGLQTLNNISDHYKVLLKAIENCDVEVTSTNKIFYEATKTEWNEPIPVNDGDSI